jgi:glycine hydroxymethyltransferase
VAGIAITLGKAQQPDFRLYCQQVLANAQTLAEMLMAGGARLITGGTENHMMVIDAVKSFGIDGRVGEETLDSVAITTNKQMIPDDPNPPLRPSGIRLGTPAATTRGMKEAEMKQLAEWMLRALRGSGATPISPCWPR